VSGFINRYFTPTALLTFFIATFTIMSFGCRLLPDYGNDSQTNSIGVAAISGMIVKNIPDNSRRPGSLPALVPADLSGTVAIANAEVWLESLSDVPGFRTTTDASGTYIFHNVPAGEYRVIVKYVDPETGLTMKNRSSQVSVSESPELVEAPDMVAKPAKNIVAGQLRDAEGNFLPEGTVLTLWGESFQVGPDGIFTSPPLPDSFLEAEIFVQSVAGKTPVSFSAPFVSEIAPAFVEFKIGTTTTGNHAPGVILSALVNDKPVTRVNPGTIVVIRAIGRDDDNGHKENLVPVWAATVGSLAAGTSSFEKLWTAPDFQTVATITVEVKDPENATGSASLPILVGIDNPSLVDTARPETTITSSVLQVLNSEPFTVTVTFNEPVIGFELEDLVLLNGYADNLKVLSADKIFSVRVTPLNAGNVDVAVAENAVRDVGGNNNRASSVVSVKNSILPVIASMNPVSAAAGASVTITGTGFTGATSVTFGGTAATTISVDSPTSITAQIPAGSGVVSVIVITPSGSSNSISFSY